MDHDHDHEEIGAAASIQCTQTYHTVYQFQSRTRITFLTLPAELRLRVYDYPLTDWTKDTYQDLLSIDVTHQKRICPGFHRATRYSSMEPAVLKVCRQTYAEASAVLYSQNVFHSSAMVSANRF
jgi:hypothetical protein